MSAAEVQVLVLAKRPRPGAVKTRLCPPCTPEQAAGLAAAALADTLAAVADVPGRVRRVAVLDGRPGPWLPPGWEVLQQRGGGLDERLGAAFADAFAGCPAPALLVGMDTPQLDGSLLAAATRRLREVDAVLGPATDGGFWALGLHRPAPGLLLGVPMSTDRTGALVRERADAAGLEVAMLPTLTDVDAFASALEVAALARDGAFATELRRLAVRERAG